MLKGGISQIFHIINAKVFGGIRQNTKQNRKNGGTRGQKTRGLNPSSRVRDAKAMRFSCFIMQLPSIWSMLI